MKTALTIGFFDGVHLGHQKILERLRRHPSATILTFSNHPQEVISPPAPKLLISFETKIELLKKYADEVIVFPFTLELASTSYDQLLSQFDLSCLILGKGSVFGKNREGNEENLRKYGSLHGIEIEYVDKLLLEGAPVSSSRIRNALAHGQIHLAKQLLGRNI